MSLEKTRTGRDGHGRPNGQKILGLSVRAKINLGKKHFPDAYLAISSFRRFLRRVPSTSQLHHIMDPPEIPNPVQSYTWKLRGSKNKVQHMLMRIGTYQRSLQEGMEVVLYIISIKNNVHIFSATRYPRVRRIRKHVSTKSRNIFPVKFKSRTLFSAKSKS
ncbi:hypothetical protein AtNW77_Chr5g0133251 [Arabidopsis thaliana]